jgi:two-component system cell cycle sensor histidine kinase/response regulator CckA
METGERAGWGTSRLGLGRRGAFASAAHPELDRLTRLAQRALQSPMAVVCLADAERSRAHGAVGVPESLAHPLCSPVLEAGASIAAADARDDARLRDHGAIAQLGVVAYAGSPLVTAEGWVVGALVVMDRVARRWEPEALELLDQLAALAAGNVQLARARREQQQRDLVLHHVGDVVYALDTDGTILSLNPAFESFTGWPAGDWVGRSFVSLLHPDDLPRMLDAISRAQGGEPAQRLEVRLLTRSGAFVAGDCTLLGHGESGAVRRLLGVIRDARSRKQVEALVARDVERWSALMDHLPDPIYFKDRDGRFTRVNRAQALVLGVDHPDQAVGKTNADFFRPEQVAAAWADEQAIMVTGEPLVSKVERVETLDGRVRWFSTTKMALRGPTGDVIGTMGSSGEITDMMRAEDELHRTLSLLSATLESTADGILVVDLAGRITSTNRKFISMWRLPEELLAARQDERLIEHVHDELKDPDAFLRRVRELYLDVEASSFDILELRDGRVFERYSQPQRIGGTIVGRVWSFRDVSERRRTEEQNRLLAHTIQSTGDIISITDLEGRFTFVNRAFLTTYGYGESEVMGRGVALIDSPRNPPGLQREIREATQGGTWRGELWNRSKDGTEFPVALTTSQIRDPDGRVVGLVGVWNDITKRRRSEAVQVAVYNIAEAASAADSLETLLQAVHRIVGELMPARNFFVALHDRGAGLLTFPYFVDQVDTADAARPLMRGLTEYVLRTGRPLLGTPDSVAALERGGEVELVGAPSLDWLGVPLKVGADTIGVLAVQSYTEGVRFGAEELGILEFVSAQVAMAIERTRSAQRLQASETKYRQLFEGNPEAMFVYDAGTLRFLAVNEAAVRRYGYSREEFLGMSLLDIRPEEEGDRLRDVLAQYRGGTARATGLRHRSQDGRLIDVEVTFDDIDFAGRPARLALVEDVTERRRLEAQLRQAQKMEAVGQLAGGIAHDFNNLLTAIIGYATLLDRALPADTDVREDVHEIIGAARRAGNLTHQLLAFSRKQVLRPTVLDVNAVVRDMERILQRVIGEHISLHTKLDPELACVLADASQLEQVIMNLAVNSRDAMPAGGRITIETANVPLDTELALAHPEAEQGIHALLAVSDTGQGMTPDVKAHLFEPFFTTKEVGKGTGLGLATVYGIVRQSGGFIAVDSEPGRGTRFRLYFPSAEPEAPEVAHASPEPAAAGSGTVLLVEDEPGVRHLARDVLSRYGYRVIEAADGAEALRLAEGHAEPIDLLLTDVVMPGMSGAELAARFRALHPGVPVLYASGYADEAVVSHGVRHEGMPFLQKPFEPDDLVRRVREVLDSK